MKHSILGYWFLSGALIGAFELSSLWDESPNWLAQLFAYLATFTPLANLGAFISTYGRNTLGVEASLWGFMFYTTVSCFLIGLALILFKNRDLFLGNKEGSPVVQRS